MGKYYGDADEHAVEVECKGEYCCPGYEKKRGAGIGLETVDQRDSHWTPCTGFNATELKG